MRPLLALAMATSLCGCNAVLGLEEGKLDGGNGGEGGATSGGARSTGAPAANGSGSGSTIDTTSSTAVNAGTTITSASSGSLCVIQNDLRNGDFTEWSDDEPLVWFLSGNLTSEAFAQQIVEGQGGLRFIVGGADDLDDYAGYWQQNLPDPPYFQCLEVRGSSRKTGGDGRLTVDVQFNGRHLEAEMPTGAQMMPFAKACILPAATDFYTVYLQVDQMPGDAGTPGGAVVEVEHLEVNHICCDGVVEMCPVLVTP